MLTKAEKKWLNERKKHWLNFCDSCPYKSTTSHLYCAFIMYHEICPTALSLGDFRDAAEFEARVSRIMALYFGAPPCMVGTCNNPNFLCPECRLKHARLKAEEEMEK